MCTYNCLSHKSDAGERRREEISAIAFASAFDDFSTFNRRFARIIGQSPGAHRAG